MDELALLTALKIDLGISSSAFDGRLLDRIRTARQRICEEGVSLTGCEADRDLVLMYAAWLWRSRVTGEGMPRMLRYALNNRVFNQKAAGVT